MARVWTHDTVVVQGQRQSANINQVMSLSFITFHQPPVPPGIKPKPSAVTYRCLHGLAPG